MKVASPLTLPSPQGEGLATGAAGFQITLVAFGRSGLETFVEQRPHTWNTAAGERKPSPRGEGRVRGLSGLSVLGNLEYFFIRLPALDSASRNRNRNRNPNRTRVARGKHDMLSTAECFKLK